MIEKNIMMTHERQEIDGKLRSKSEEIMDIIGSNGRYQNKIVKLGSLMMIAAGFISCWYSYMASEPVTTCLISTPNSPPEYSSCPEEMACELKDSKLPMSRVSFSTDGWTKEYNLACERGFQRGEGQVASLIVNLLGCSMVMIFCDIYGRLFGVKLTLTLVILGSLVCLTVDNYLLKMIGLGAASINLTTLSVLLPVIVAENSSQKSGMRERATSIFYIYFGIGTILFNLLAYFSTHPTFLIGSTLPLLLGAGLPFVFCVKDGPDYSLKKYDMYGYQRVTGMIADANGFESVFSSDTKHSSIIAEMEGLMRCGIELRAAEEARDWKEKAPLFRLLSNRKDLCAVVGMSAVFTYMSCLYTGLSVNMQDLGLETIQMNGVVYGVMQIVGLLATNPVIHKLNKKKAMVVCQTVMMAGAAGLFLLSFQKKTEIVMILRATLSTGVIGITLGVLYTVAYLFLMDLFPVTIRTTASSLIIFFSNLISIFTPVFSRISQSQGIHVLVGCSIFGLMSLPFTFTLRTHSDLGDSTISG